MSFVVLDNLFSISSTVLKEGIVRRYALDRAPTLEELREILDAADIRGKALTLVLVSSGIREGAVPHLRVSKRNE